MSTKNHRVLAGSPYNIGPEIGRGSFANVYKGVNTVSKSVIAIKSVQLSRLNEKLLENLDHEITILKKMKHPHIVSLLDTYKTPSHFYLVMEYCSLGDLSYLSRKRKSNTADPHPIILSMFQRYPCTSEGGLHEDVSRHFLKQLASSLEFLRQNQLIHRDIKPQNLLLCPPLKSKQLASEAGIKGHWDLPILQLADFGFARILPSTSMAETLCGSPLYMAPEILRLEKYTAKADLWSVGAVLYEMVSGKPPFKASNHVELLSVIEKTNNEIQFSESVVISADIKRLIRALLKKDPTERMSFAEFFNDPVITETNSLLDQSSLNTNTHKPENLELSHKIRVMNNMFRPLIDPSHKSTNDSLPISGASTKQKNQRQLQSKPTKPDFRMDQHVPPSPPRSVPKNNTDQYLGTASTESSSWVISHNARPIQKLPSSPSSVATTHLTTHKVVPQAPESIEPKYTSNKDPFSRPVDSESEYVVVEKRTIEVNYFADELAPSANDASPSVNTLQLKPSPVSNLPSPQQKEYYQNQYYQYTQNHINRRNSSTRSSAGPNTGITSTATNASPRSKPNIANPRHKNTSAGSTSLNSLETGSVDSTPPPAARPERRNSIIYGSSPSNALSRALHMVSARILGKSHNDNVEGYLVSNHLTPHHRRSVSFVDPDEQRLLKSLENLQSKSKVLILFAEVKYQQLTPSGNSETELDDETTVLVALEAFALYYKSLALLDKFMKIASQWWQSYCQMAAAAGGSSNGILQGGTHTVSPGNVFASGNLVDLVQWARDQFNECLARADYAQGLINKRQTKPIKINTRGLAERLIFERALDMSKSAAKLEKLDYSNNETVGNSNAGSHRVDNNGATTPTATEPNNNNNKTAEFGQITESIKSLEECLMSYSTAIWMLETMLENTEDEKSRDIRRGKYLDISIALDAPDRERVIKAIESVSQ